jgi:hypothetical protein
MINFYLIYSIKFLLFYYCENLLIQNTFMSFLKSFLDKILGSNTLYYPGCLTKALLPEIQKNYEDILNEL